MNQLVLDVRLANNNVGAIIQMYSSNNTDAQKWCWTTDGYFQSGLRMSDGRDLVLEVTPSNTLQLNIKNNTNAQKWLLGSDGLMSQSNGQFLDIKNADSSQGATLWLYVKNGTNAQAWNFRSTSPPTPTPVGM